MSRYIFGHVKEDEQHKFGRYTMTERKYAYTRAILSKKSYSYYKLNKALKWKFGSGIGRKIYKDIKETL